MKTFLVKFKVCEQTSPDDYEMTTREKLFYPETTLEVVKQWILDQKGFIRTDSGYKRMIEVYLSEPQ
jgi:hypothetical protein